MFCMPFPILNPIMEVPPPEFVRRSDGAVEPFEPERITRALFAAAERAGQADAFLARELTESVTHFLETEAAGGTLDAAEIADTVARVVRELGHPTLAKAFEDRNQRPAPAGVPVTVVPVADRLTRRRAADAEFSLSRLFPRELVAAHAEGLIAIGGLEAPMELAGLVGADDAGLVGEYAADDLLDWPPRHLGDSAAVAGQLFQVMRERAHVGDVRVLGHCRLPGDDGDSAPAPAPALFPAEPRAEAGYVRDTLIALSKKADAAVRWHWHLSAVNPDAALAGPLPNLADAEFVFDHPKRPVWLGPGLSRDSKSALIRVGVNIERLLEMVGGWPADVDTLLHKAAALARFAKTAGHVKQDWLRKHGPARLREAFLLDRAAVVIVPLGLSAIISRHGLLNSDAPRLLLAAIRQAVETDRPRQIPVVVDSDWTDAGALVELPAAATRNDWKAAGQLCGAANGGLVICRTGPGDDIAEILKIAGRAGIGRVRFTT